MHTHSGLNAFTHYMLACLAGDDAGGDDMDSDEPAGGAVGTNTVIGPDGMVDIEAVKRRLKSTVAVLEDFGQRRAPGRSRSDYMDTVRQQQQQLVQLVLLSRGGCALLTKRTFW